MGYFILSHSVGKNDSKTQVGEKRSLEGSRGPDGAKRDVQLTTRLRCARQYPTIYARTNRYKSSSCIWTKLFAVM